MKTIILAALSSLIFLSSCSKEDTNSTTASGVSLSAVNSTIVSGNLRVTNYLDNNSDHTSDFSGYTFNFNNNGIVTATRSGTTVTGTWSSGNDDSQVKIILSFTGNASFSEISDDWHVIERTSTKIRLQDISRGSGAVEYLTFEAI